MPRFGADKFAFPQLLYSSRICGLNATHKPRPKEAVAWASHLASLFGCQRARLPRAEHPVPDGTFKIRTVNKKPGVERRANSPHTQTGESARSSTDYYPVFVPDLTRALCEPESLAPLNRPDSAGHRGSIPAFPNASRGAFRDA